MFKCEHCFKKCEYTDSQRMIHTAVGPELQKKRENIYKNINLNSEMSA
jgi:predicted metal-binding protein